MSAIELFGRWPPIAKTIIDHLPYCIVKAMTCGSRHVVRSEKCREPSHVNLLNGFWKLLKISCVFC